MEGGPGEYKITPRAESDNLAPRSRTTPGENRVLIELFAGVDRSLVSGALTHTNERATERYIRKVSAIIATVAEARGRKRAADEGTA